MNSPLFCKFPVFFSLFQDVTFKNLIFQVSAKQRLPCGGMDEAFLLH